MNKYTFNREIKFRAWIEGCGLVYLEPFNHVIRDEGQGNFYLGSFDSARHSYYDSSEIMQYTGLKDKNGVDIYEGDIVRRDDRLPEGEVLFKVYWDQAFSQFLFDPFITESDSELDEFPRSYHDLYYCEVVGNIYENPEVLGG